MIPQHIPCITTSNGRHEIVDCHLISPRKDKPFFKANKITIVDCFTFGLRRNQHINPYDHYSWYIDFVAENQNDSDLVFIAPDWEWLKETSNLNKKWLNRITTAKCLVVPESFLYDKVENVVGHALKSYQNLAHSEWTHSFSCVHATSLIGNTKKWTYDT